MEPKAKEKRSVKTFCCVTNCFNNKLVCTDLSTFRLPLDKERAAIWLSNIQCDHRRKVTLVCEAHFEERFIVRHKSKKILTKDAVPTLNLTGAAVRDDALDYVIDYDDTDWEPYYEADRIGTLGLPHALISNMGTPNISTGSPNIGTPITGTSNIDSVQSNIGNKIVKTEVFIEETETDIKETEIDVGETAVVSKPCSSSVRRLAQLLRNTTMKCKGEEYTDTFKEFSLTLYSTSANTYRVLHNKLQLPSYSELRRLCILESTKMNKNIVMALSARARDMTDDQKQCAICVGTMALKPNLYYDQKNDKVIGFHEVEGIQKLELAKFLLVIMVRGLFHDWQQLISYSFIAESQNYKDVNMQLDKNFRIMFQIGFRVRVCISNIESEFLNIVKHRNISSELPYFYLDDNKIYYMYDPPHIVTAVRDNLLKYDFSDGNDVCRWQHILDFYEIEQSRSVKFAPKLSPAHMTATLSQRDSLLSSAQIFSNSTALGMSAYIDMGLLDASARETVNWIVKLNALFDMLNFTTFANTKLIFTGHEMWRIEFLREIMCWLDKIFIMGDVKADTAKLNFVKAYKISINVVLSLCEDFKTEKRNFKRPRFTQDSLDAFYAKIREKFGEPSCKTLRSVMRTLPTFNILQWKGQTESSEALERFLEAANDISTIRMFKPVKVNVVGPAIGYLSLDEDYKAVELPRGRALQCFAEYVLRQSARPAGCAAACGGAAPLGFVDYIQLLQNKTKEYFASDTVNNPILSNLLDFLKNDVFVMPSQCFQVDFTKKLYARYRLYLLLKYNNKLYRSAKTNKRPFIVNELH